MDIQTRRVVNSPRVTTNSDVVIERLLSRDDHAPVTAHSATPIETSATYSQPPLALATEIAWLMQKDFLVRRLIGYYQQAWIERGTPSWALHLYKVRDLFQKKYDGACAAQSALAIPNKEWECFGRLLNNNDLRHAEIDNVPPTIGAEDVLWLYNTARRWIARYLEIKGVRAVG